MQQVSASVHAPTLRVGWLVSYAAIKQYPKLWIEARAASVAGVPLVIDSGAFSVATTGNPVSLLAYTNWLRKGERWRIAQWCASLDVVGDPLTSYKNHESIVRSGVNNAVPTLHLGASTDWLARYAQLGTKRVALGGITTLIRRTTGGTDEDVQRWLGAVLPVMERHGMVAHGFGVTSRKLIEPFDWDSVDSTSFASGTRFRTVPIFMDGALHGVHLSKLTSQHVLHLQRIGVNAGVMGNAFVVGRNGSAQWGELLRAGLMGVATAVHKQNPRISTLYVSDWQMGHHVLPLMTLWNKSPETLHAIMEAHK